MGRPVTLGLAVLLSVTATSGLLGCGGGGGGRNTNGNGNGNVNTDPVVLDPSDFTYTLSESPGNLPL